MFLFSCCVSAAAPLLYMVLRPVSKEFVLPFLFPLLLASFPVLLGHVLLSKGLSCFHYQSEYHLASAEVQSVVTSGFPELLSSFFLLL